MAVCPAGEDVLPPFQDDRKTYLQDTLHPLQEKEETIYVVSGSDAEEHVNKRFPHKKPKPVGNSLLPSSIRGFLAGLPVVFQRKQSAGLDATYHFTFTGEETERATIVIRNQTLQVLDGHHGRATFRMTADGQTWIGFLKKERNLAWALVRRKIRFRGSPKLLLAFGRCFLG